MRRIFFVLCVLLLFLATGNMEAQSPTKAGPHTGRPDKETAVLKNLTVRDADELVRELRKLFPSDGPRSIWATGTTSLSVYATPADQKAIAATVQRLEGTESPHKGGKSPTLPEHVEGVPKNDLPPVKVTPFGNRLIVSSEDPQALELISQLARMFTQGAQGEGDFEVIRLRNASAPDVAKILDEIYNGKTEPPRGSRGGIDRQTVNSLMASVNLMGRGRNSRGGLASLVNGLGLSGGGSGTRVEKVRIVADSAANTLIVKATPLDMLTIQSLVASLDHQPDEDVDAVKRTHVIGPLKYAQATEVASILKSVFKDALTGTQTNRAMSPIVTALMGGRRQRFGRGATTNVQTSSAALSIGVHEKTNMIVVDAPTPLYERIEDLVIELDTAAANVNTVVEVLPIDGVSPTTLEQALEALQQNRTTTNRTATGGASNRSVPRGRR